SRRSHARARRVRRALGPSRASGARTASRARPLASAAQDLTVHLGAPGARPRPPCAPPRRGAAAVVWSRPGGLNMATQFEAERSLSGIDHGSVVAEASPAERAAFITRTYLHLLGAI